MVKLKGAVPLGPLLFIETMAAYLGISIFVGILRRRADRWGAIASLRTPLIVNVSILDARGERLNHWEPKVFGSSLLPGIAALINAFNRPQNLIQQQ